MSGSHCETAVTGMRITHSQLPCLHVCACVPYYSIDMYRTSISNYQMSTKCLHYHESNVGREMQKSRAGVRRYIYQCKISRASRHQQKRPCLSINAICSDATHQLVFDDNSLACAADSRGCRRTARTLTVSDQHTRLSNTVKPITELIGDDFQDAVLTCTKNNRRHRKPSDDLVWTD